jgi:hypothetical protein
MNCNELQSEVQYNRHLRQNRAGSRSRGVSGEWLVVSCEPEGTHAGIRDLNGLARFRMGASSFGGCERASLAARTEPRPPGGNRRRPGRANLRVSRNQIGAIGIAHRPGRSLALPGAISDWRDWDRIMARTEPRPPRIAKHRLVTPARANGARAGVPQTKPMTRQRSVRLSDGSAKSVE